MDTQSHDYQPRSHGQRTDASGVERLTERLTEYLRTRTSEHWVMFLAGLVVGSLLG